MGSCFSWLCSCKGDQDRETTRLLGSGTGSASSQRIRKRRILSDSLPDVGDEDSAFNKILQEAAEEFLDVHTLNCSDYDHDEFVDRMNDYEARLSGASKWSAPGRRSSFLRDISAPDKVLSAKPVKTKDFVLIKKAANKIRSASVDIQVEHKEVIVVPFQSY